MTASDTPVKWGRLRDAADEANARQAAVDDPGRYHGDIAAAELHWHDAEHGHWLRRAPDTTQGMGSWQGFDAADGAPVGESTREPDWRPWRLGFDDSHAPFYRWFAGALTNACYNDIDRHVLGGRGAHPAFTVTLGVETERLPTVPAVNQVQLTRRARAEEPGNDQELAEEMERLVHAVLQCSVPAPTPAQSRYLARIYRGNAVTV